METHSEKQHGRGRTLRRSVIHATGMLIRLITALALVAMTLITVTDVVGRYLFNAPLRGADELTVITLGIAVFSGLPLAIAQRGMISVEILSAIIPGGLQLAFRAVSDLVSGAFLAVCAWQIALKAEKIASYGDTTLFLRIPLAPLICVIAVAVFVSALVFIGLALTAILDRPKIQEGAT